MKRKLFFLSIAFVGMITSSCTYSPYVAPEVESVLFSGQIQPIFDDKCTYCHPSSGKLDLTKDNSYASLMAQTGRVDTLNPPASLIVTKPASNSNHPAIYNAQEELLVVTWIEEGAKNN